MSGWDDYYMGMKYSWSFYFNEENMKTFSSLSGDYHPIHLNKSFARSNGCAPSPCTPIVAFSIAFFFR